MSALLKLHMFAPLVDKLRKTNSKLAVLQVSSDGWVGATDGHRILRVWFSELDGRVEGRLLDLSQYRASLKDSKEALRYLQDGPSSNPWRDGTFTSQPDLTGPTIPGIVAEWRTDPAKHRELIRFLKRRRRELRARYKTEARESRAKLSELNQRHKANIRELSKTRRSAPKGRDKESVRLRQEARAVYKFALRSEQNAYRDARLKVPNPRPEVAVWLVPTKAGLYLSDEFHQVSTGPLLATPKERSPAGKVPARIDIQYLLDALESSSTPKAAMTIRMSATAPLQPIEIQPNFLIGQLKPDYWLIMPMRA